MTRDEYLKLLRDNADFKSVLDKAPDDKERRAIKAYAEDMMMNFYEVYTKIAAAVQRDPDAINKAFREIQDDLIKSKSGSTGS